jgi:peptidoglycan/LPS O-acetylase OafA/YrhL
MSYNHIGNRCMQPLAYQPGKHFAPFDGLRGVAILMVIACHTRLGDSAVPFDAATRSLFGFGVHGVDLFFVLSGFLITGILLDGKGADGYFRTFYLRRTLRIFPLYYLYLALRLLVAPALAHRFHLTMTPLLTPQADGGFFWLYASNLLPVIHPDTLIEGGLFHLWSLAIEEQFYLVWPLLVFLLPVRWLVRVSVLLIAASLCFRMYFVHLDAEAAAFEFTFCRLDALAAGALISIAVRQSVQFGRLRRAGWALMAFALLGIGWRMATNGWGNTHAYWIVIWGTAFAVLLCTGLVLELVGGGARLQAIFNQGWLRRIGKYSYSMYVFHFVVLRAVMGPVEKLHLPHLGGSYALEQAIDFIGVTAVTFLVGMITWHAFEKWFLKLKRQINYGPRQRGGAGPTALAA